MTKLEEILNYNKKFVQEGIYEQYMATKFPDKKFVIVTCMDTRLSGLLLHAMNLRNGDANMIKCAGAVVSHPYGSIMRSILVSIYKLQAEEVFIIAHHDCGMIGMHLDSIVDDILQKGISNDILNQISEERDLNRWLRGFNDISTSVKESVEMVKNHPLLPSNILVHGLIIDPHTGKLEEVVNGYNT